ncbi:MAG: GntR family transcriptional regulator [Burkholderiaceae bacterium]
MTKSSTADRVYQTLVLEIRSGALRAGDRLGEEAVAQRLGCSRTPVREALSRLLSRGLAELGPGRVLTIRLLSRAQIVQLYEMRQILEGAAARLAAKHASRAEVESLREMLATQARLSRQSGPKVIQALSTQNSEFHHALVEAAHNPYLQDMSQRMEESLWLLGSTTYAAKGRAPQALKEHEDLVQAIAEGDETMAEQLARDHIERALQVRLALPRPL